jgi:hypothetical protein
LLPSRLFFLFLPSYLFAYLIPEHTLLRLLPYNTKPPAWGLTVSDDKGWKGDWAQHARKNMESPHQPCLNSLYLNLLFCQKKLIPSWSRLWVNLATCSQISAWLIPLTQWCPVRLVWTQRLFFQVESINNLPPCKLQFCRPSFWKYWLYCYQKAFK